MAWTHKQYWLNSKDAAFNKYKYLYVYLFICLIARFILYKYIYKQTNKIKTVASNYMYDQQETALQNLENRKENKLKEISINKLFKVKILLFSKLSRTRFHLIE